MKWRVVGNKRDGFKALYKRGNLWCYVTEVGGSTWPKYTARVFSNRETAESYAKLYADQLGNL